MDGHESEVLTSVEDCACACPICGSVTERVWRASRRAVIGDEIDETHPDLDPLGGVVRFRSKIEKQKYLDAHQLEPFVRWAGPHDQHLKRWDLPCAYTLEQAALLVARVAEQSTASDPAVRCETLTTSIRAIPWRKV
jgi:hypothetical protein